jgi:hypothetical protein
VPPAAQALGTPAAQGIAALGAARLAPPPPTAHTCPTPNPPPTRSRRSYAADQAAFFADNAAAHLKLSELGVEWAEGGPVQL